MLLIYIGDKWFLDKDKSKLYSMKKQKLNKEENKKDDNIKLNLKKYHQHWNDFKFQINWN